MSPSNPCMKQKFYNHIGVTEHDIQTSKYNYLLGISSCKRCGGKVSRCGITGFCQKCSAKERRPTKYWLGKKHTEEYKKKMSVATKGRTNSEETRKKISESKKGIRMTEEHREKLRKVNLGKILSEETKKKISLRHIEKGIKPIMNDAVKEKLRQAHIGKNLSLAQRMKQSEALKGRMPANLGYVGKYGNVHRGYYSINGKEMFFRSKWEANYALYLDFMKKYKKIKDWEYEVDLFMFEKIKLGTRSYRPDFKVHNNDGTVEYHEVKGHMNQKSITKLKRMAKYYPNIKLVLIDSDQYKELSKSKKLFNWY